MKLKALDTMNPSSRHDDPRRRRGPRQHLADPVDAPNRLNADDRFADREGGPAKGLLLGGIHRSFRRGAGPAWRRACTAAAAMKIAKRDAARRRGADRDLRIRRSYLPRRSGTRSSSGTSFSLRRTTSRIESPGSSRPRIDFNVRFDWTSSSFTNTIKSSVITPALAAGEPGTTDST